jgi:L-2-hydroxyglutarate oxidase
MVHGGIEAGPNAVLAFKREGYNRWQLDIAELWEVLRYQGFHKLAAKNWKFGLEEMKRSYFKNSFVKALQRLVPALQPEDVVPDRSGVRAMALDKTGNVVDDFMILQNNNVINVLNAPSPAATSCLSIGEHIAGLIVNG